MTESVEQFAKAQEAEYGTWRAKAVIYHDGARAYNPGDPVPVSNVKDHGYDKADLVEKVPTSEKPASTVKTEK
jgi:hypothetical protein